MNTISPSILLRELAGSIDLSDSEDGTFGYDGENDADDAFDDNDDTTASDVTTDDMDAQLDALLGAESRSAGRKKWEKQRKLRRSTRAGDDEDEAVALAVRHRLKALPSTTCSICFEDESDATAAAAAFVRLDCNHRFCADCLRAYTANEIQDVARVLHKRATLRRLAANDWAIEFGWSATIRCPAAQCAGLVDAECMQHYATPDQIAVFERFAAARRAQIDAAAARVSEVARRNAAVLEAAKLAHRDPQGRLFVRGDGVMHCARCGEWAVEPASRGRLRCTACLQPYCSTCTMSHLRRYACDYSPKTTISVTLAEKHFIQMITMRPDGLKYRMCPRCDTLIEKNMGCDHHVCRACNHSYNWSASPIPTLRNVDKWCKEIFFVDTEFSLAKKANNKKQRG